MVVGERVEVNGLRGTVIKVRFDSRLEPIYTIDLDDKEATPDGIYYARRQELTWIGYSGGTNDQIIPR